MPDSVKKEFLIYKDVDWYGFSPGVDYWLNTCTHPRLERWRHDMYAWQRREKRRAVKNTIKMTEFAREAYSGSRSSIRTVAVIDPFLKAHMESIHGRNIWHDPEALKDTRKQAPKLFVN